MGKLSKTLKVIDDVATGAKRLDNFDPDNAPTLRMMDAWEEYEALSGAEPSIRVTPGPTPIDAEIAAEKAAEAESRRISAITSPAQEDMNYLHQARNPKEFKARVQNQLDNPDYAALVVNSDKLDMGGIGVTPDWVRVRNEADQLMQTRTKAGPMRNPRYAARVKAATKDSAYEDRVFYHVERQADDSGKLPQFGPNPHELGLHSGTYAAAIQATVRSEEAMEQALQMGDELIEMLAMPLDMTPKQVAQQLIPQLERFFTLKFQGVADGPAGAVFDELAANWGRIAKENGFPEQEIGRTIARLRRLPTASVTPHYFRGRNGLHLSDVDGNWFDTTVIDQLRKIFPNEAPRLRQILNAPRNDRTVQIQKFIEDQGYDHVVYHNQAEDHGTLSIINWNEDLMVPVWADELLDGSTDGIAKAKAQFALAMMGFGLGGTSAIVRNEE